MYRKKFTIVLLTNLWIFILISLKLSYCNKENLLIFFENLFRFCPSLSTSSLRNVFASFKRRHIGRHRSWTNKAFLSNKLVISWSVCEPKLARRQKSNLIKNGFSPLSRIIFDDDYVFYHGWWTTLSVENVTTPKHSQII